MSLSNLIIKVIGVIVALLGLALVLAAFGIETGAHIPVTWWIEGIVGLLLIGAGAWIVKGGNITF